MPAHSFSLGVWVSIALAGLANAHIAAFHWAMYCVNGTDPTANPINNNAPVQPLYNMSYNDFWMHHSNGCDEFPPDPNVFLELDAGGNFTVELAGNRAETSLNPLAKLTDWGDGLDHPDNYSGDPCITSPNLHTRNQSMAAGTSWAISYTSDIKNVTLDNLIVISVLPNSPFKRSATYQVPSGLPECPEGGCICTWNWVPNDCGILNMYMMPYRCKVNPDSSPKTIGKPQPPAWCEGNESNCVKGPKQIIVWHQLEANNVPVEGYDSHGKPKVPVYDMNCGFQNGAQNDIFVDSSTLDASNSTTPSTTPKSSTPLSGSATPTPSVPPTESGARAEHTNSSLPTGSNTPACQPPVSGTPSSPPPSFLPSGSVTPSADPNLPSGSGAHTGSHEQPTDTCSSPSPSPTSAGARRSTHSKRMQRERHGMF